MDNQFSKLKSVSARVRLYPDGAVQCQWIVANEFKITILIEVDKEGDWVAHLYESKIGIYENRSTSKENFQSFQLEFCILFYLCLIALEKTSRADRRYRSGMCAAAKDSWLRNNVLSIIYNTLQNESFKKTNFSVDIVGENDLFGVGCVEEESVIIINIGGNGAINLGSP